MVGKKGAFVLTRTHLDRGVTAEDMSAHAGIPVALAYHDDFPHSRELRESMFLPEGKLDERYEALARYLKNVNFDVEEDDVPDIRNVAGFASAVCHGIFFPLDTWDIQTDRNGGWRNPSEINRRYFYPGTEAQEGDIDRWVVVPKPPEDWLVENQLEHMAASESLVICDPRDELPEIYTALHTSMNRNRITNVLDIEMGRLNTRLHEMRHFVQVSTFSQKNPYEEIDANLFARAVLRNQLPLLHIDPTEHLRDDLFTRYAQLLAAPCNYRTASAIEAFEAGREPPAVKDVDFALDEIQRRIIQEETGKSFLPQDPTEFLWRCKDEAEVVYGLLRRCAEADAFIRNPLANQIAHKILESVEHFSAGVTRTPSVINRIYPVRALSL